VSAAAGGSEAFAGLALEAHDAPDPPGAAEIRAALIAHNSQVGDPKRQPLVLLLRDEAGTPRAGLLAELVFGWLSIQTFFVDPALRGQGVGSRLLAEAEARAKAKGAIGAHLNTSTFQAPAFYARHGYSEIGRLPDRPPGHARLWVAKRWG
jgi:GNAT superfamily N-acetyltransferase